MSDTDLPEAGCMCFVLVLMMAAFLFVVGLAGYAGRFAWQAWSGW